MPTRSRKCSKRDERLAAASAATTTVSATTATARAAASTPAASAFAGNHGAGFVDNQCTSHEIAAVASFDGTISRGVVVNFNESESASLACETVTHHVHAVHGNTRLREEIR
jgi:hypothetical protein